MIAGMPHSTASTCKSAPAAIVVCCAARCASSLVYRSVHLKQTVGAELTSAP